MWLETGQVSASEPIQYVQKGTLHGWTGCRRNPERRREEERRKEGKEEGRKGWVGSG